MMKKLLLFLFSLFFLLVFAKPASANLLSIDKDGQIVWDVLGQEDAIGLAVPQSSDITLNKVAESSGDTNSLVSLEKKDGKVSLLVNEGGGRKSLDVTNWKDSVIEIEERPQVQKIQIAIAGDKFEIKNAGVSAVTSFPITVDPKTAKVSVTTQTGDKYISVFPREAAESALKSRVVDSLKTNQIVLTEEGNELTYKVNGEKLLNLFNVYKYPVDVEAQVSAYTGEIVKTNAPIWLTIASYLFS
jgi:hypothetical protein